MIIFDLADNCTKESKGIMAKRRNVKDSFGKRVRDERESLGLTQSDMIELLRERYGIQMSEAAFSKIEIGETKRLHIDLQMAIAGILQTDIHEGLLCRYRTVHTFYSVLLSVSYPRLKLLGFQQTELLELFGGRGLN